MCALSSGFGSLIDAFPPCVLFHTTLVKHIPEWFPGASFKRSAIITRKSIAEWVEAPFEYVKKSMVSSRSFAPSDAIVGLTGNMSRTL